MPEDVSPAADHVDQHRAGDLHRRGERLRLRLDEPPERGLAPRHEPLRRLLADDLAPLLGIVAGLLERLQVLALVLGSLDDDGAGGVEAGAPGTPGDLVELARVQLPHPGAVELGEGGQQHGADGDVDAHAESVGPADDPEHPALRQLLDQSPVLRQHAGVVHPDPLPQEARQRLAERRGEPESADQLRDRVALLPAGDAGARQRLRPLERRELREVHDVDRRLTGRQQVVDRLVDRRQLVVVVQRDGAIHAGHARRLTARAPAEVVGERRHVAQRGRHQQELRARQGEERHLPGPAAVRVAVEVELVHHDLTDRGVRPVPQGEVGQDLGGAADDGGIRVDRRVARHHPDVLGPEDLDQREELLGDEGFDRGRVERPLAACQRREMGADRHQRLAGSCGCAQDDVRTGDDLDERFVLRRVERDPALLDPADDGAVHGVVVDLGRTRVSGDVVDAELSGRGHGPPSLPRRRTSGSQAVRLRSAHGVLLARLRCGSGERGGRCRRGRAAERVPGAERQPRARGGRPRHRPRPRLAEGGRHRPLRHRRQGVPRVQPRGRPARRWSTGRTCWSCAGRRSGAS